MKDIRILQHKMLIRSSKKIHKIEKKIRTLVKEYDYYKKELIRKHISDTKEVDKIIRKLNNFKKRLEIPKSTWKELRNELNQKEEIYLNDLETEEENEKDIYIDEEYEGDEEMEEEEIIDIINQEEEKEERTAQEEERNEKIDQEEFIEIGNEDEERIKEEIMNQGFNPIVVIKREVLEALNDFLF